eukprot:2416066-Rhodomonas_salina.6
MALRTCYAESGTEVPYAATRSGRRRGRYSERATGRVGSAIFYALAMRCPVLTQGILLCACYAMPGTYRNYALDHSRTGLGNARYY